MNKILSLLILGLLWSCSPHHPEIHEWRGEGRSGRYPDTDLLEEWPGEGPAELWYLDGIGNGYGSPVIAGDRIYVTGELDSIAILHCIDLEGKLVWSTPFGDEWMKSFPGSRSAPTVMGDLVYVGSGMGNLYCVDREDGSVVWSRDYAADFQGECPFNGHSEAAVVKGDKVFWIPGGPVYNVVALDRFSGELLWSNSGFSERSAYNPSQIIQLPGRDLFVTFSAYHLMGFDTETGDLLWSHEQESYPPEKRKPGYGDTHANTVLYEEGSVYYVAGDGNCGVKLDMKEDGSEITEVWRNKDLNGYMGGIVKIGNHIYGSTSNKPRLVSIDVTTGLLTDSLKVGQGAIIAADERLYYYNHSGEMNLISYEDGKMKLISSFRIQRGSGHHFSHPVINRGILYQRHGNTLMAYQVGTFAPH